MAHACSIYNIYLLSHLERLPIDLHGLPKSAKQLQNNYNCLSKNFANYGYSAATPLGIIKLQNGIYMG